MKQTVRLGRIVGIPVGMHWSVLGIMVLLVEGLAVVVLPQSAPGLSTITYWVAGFVASLLFLFSLLAHEMAHALLARRFGIRVERVTLWLLGGVAEFADDAPHARADLLVAAVGPATSFGAGLVFGGAGYGVAWLGAPPIVTASLVWLALVNLVLAVFNLLPGAPLDGGRVLRALLWQWRGNRDWAAIAAARAGNALGVLLVLGGFAEIIFTGSLNGLWLALIGWFLISAANSELTAARYHSLLGRVEVSAVMSTDLVCGDPNQSVDDFVRAVASQSGHRAFPLRAPDGRPAGVVRLPDLARVPAGQRATTALDRVAVPVALAPVVAATAPVADIAPIVARGGLALVADEDGGLVGVVSAQDVTRATELAEFSPPPPGAEAA